MNKKYTRKQILESIKYWEKQLRKGNYARLNEGKIADFFNRVFKTKKFKAAQKEIEKQKNYKEHPLMKVAEKMNKGPFFVRFTNVDMENNGYPQTFSHNYDCIAVWLDPNGNDRYDNIADRKNDIMDFAYKCGLPDGYKFYQVNDAGGVIASDEASGWNVASINESQTLNEGKIADFFNRVFKTKKFKAAQKEIEKQKNYKEHPLMKVAEKIEQSKELKKFDINAKFANVDIENDGYPQTFSDKFDCIVFTIMGGIETIRYEDINEYEDAILECVKKYGNSENYRFLKIGRAVGIVVDGAKGYNNVVSGFRYHY